MNKRFTIGFLTILILVSSIIYITLQGEGVRIRVDKDKTTLYVFEDSRWKVGGKEYNKLFEGTHKLYRDVKNIKIYTIVDNLSNTTTIIRETPFKRGPFIRDTYYFRGDIKDKKLFPIYHKVEIYNASGLFYRYEVRDLTYSGDTHKLKGETYLSFGRNVVVRLHPNYRWAWVYKSGIVKAQYDIKSDYEVFYVKLFDPASNVTLYLDDVSADRYYEHGTVAILKANATNSTGDLVPDATVCLDIDQVGYGDNYICDDGSVEYNLTANAMKDTFNDNTKHKLIYKNDTLYIKLHSKDVVQSFEFQINSIKNNVSYHENFTTTTYKDTGTAEWNTSLGVLRLTKNLDSKVTHTAYGETGNGYCNEYYDIDNPYNSYDNSYSTYSKLYTYLYCWSGSGQYALAKLNYIINNSHAGDSYELYGDYYLYRDLDDNSGSPLLYVRWYIYNFTSDSWVKIYEKNLPYGDGYESGTYNVTGNLTSDNVNANNQSKFYTYMYAVHSGGDCYGYGYNYVKMIKVGNQSIEFYNPDIAQNMQSKPITSSLPFTYVYTSSITNVPNGTLTLYLSADNGSHWETANLNGYHYFSYPGYNLRWKVVMQTNDKTMDVNITELNISTEWANGDLQVDLLNDGILEYEYYGLENGYEVIKQFTNGSTIEKTNTAPGTYYAYIRVHNTTFSDFHFYIVGDQTDYGNLVSTTWNGNVHDDQPPYPGNIETYDQVYLPYTDEKDYYWTSRYASFDIGTNASGYLYVTESIRVCNCDYELRLYNYSSSSYVTVHQTNAGQDNSDTLAKQTYVIPIVEDFVNSSSSEPIKVVWYFHCYDCWVGYRCYIDARVYDVYVYSPQTNLSIYPRNLTIDIGSDKDYEANISELNGIFLINNTSAVNNYVTNYCSSFPCEIPIKISYLSGRGKFNLTNLYAKSNTTIPALTFNNSYINDYLDTKTGYVNVPIKVTSNQWNPVNFSNITLEYWGSDNITITAHLQSDPSVNDTHIVKVVYSRFNYSIPVNYGYLEFIPNTPTDKNVSAFGQLEDIPALNITWLNYDQPANLSIKINETHSCINITASTTYNKSAGYVLNTSYVQIDSNKNLTNNTYIYLWADYACNYSEPYWRWWVPEFLLKAVCSSCVKTD